MRKNFKPFATPFYEEKEFEAFSIYGQYEVSLEFAHKKKTMKDWETFDMDDD